MKKLIFGINNFFGSGHFLIIFFEKNGQKMTGAKKIFEYKNQYFHTFQMHKRNFEIHAYFQIF